MAERTQIRMINGKATRVRVDDQGTILGPAEDTSMTTPREIHMGGSQGPLGALGGLSRAPLPEEKLDTTGGAQLLGGLAEFGVGMAFRKDRALAMLADLLVGGASGLATGDKWEGPQNAALGGIGGMIGKGAPKAFNTGAGLLGGLDYKEAKAASTALGEVNQGRGLMSRLRQAFTGDPDAGLRVPLGSEAKLDPLKERGKQLLQEAELAGKQDIPLGEAISGRIPGTTGPTAESTITRIGKEARSSTDPGATRREVYQSSKKYYKAQAKEHPTGTINQRDLGNLKRARKDEAQALIESRQAGEYRSPDKKLAEQIASAREQAHRNVQYYYDTPTNAAPKGNLKRLLSGEIGKPPAAVGPIRAANERLAPIYKTHAANAALRAPGVFADTGKMSGRAGLASGMARGAAGMTLGAAAGGQQGGAEGAAWGGALGGILGPVVLSPRVFSTIGHGVGTAGDLGPQGVRLWEALYGPPGREQGGVEAIANSIKNRQEEKRKVKRKEPK